MLRIFSDFTIKTSILIFTLGLLIGCNKNNTLIYRNMSFKEMQNNALAQNSPFCVVLIDSNDYMSKEYISFLEKDYNYLLNSALYNIAEINDENNN